MRQRFAHPASLAEALVDEDRRVAEEAYVVLRRRVARCRHPAVLRATAAEFAELVQDVALQLTREPATVAAATVYTWRGLDTAIYRWVDQCRGDSIEDRAAAWQEHLWHKVGAALRQSGRFVAVQEGPVTGYVLVDAPVTEGLSVEEVASRLPAVAAQLQSARGDQLGEVITRDDLLAQLARVFTLGGNSPRTRAVLVALVLGSLAIARGPRCESLDADQGAAMPDPGAGAAVEGTLTDRDARRLAEDFVASLAPRTRAAARLRWPQRAEAPRTLDAVGRALGVSRGTAENEVGDARGRFSAALRALCEREALTYEEQQRTLEYVFEMLEAAPSHPDEDTAP